MIFNYLELNNFRQFVGKQRINFSSDLNKKVTIIIAESGVGKTTLIQSFQWVFYGESKYKNPMNSSIRQSMGSYDNTEVSCSINLVHEKKEYTIIRTQKFYKANIQVQVDPSILVIDIKELDGTTKQVKGRDAEKIIKELMHKDLFPYFFLEGESLIRVGEQMSKGKSSSNSEFVKAIKGLLGFNYLYEAQKHLQTVSSSYQEDISRNTNDEKLKQIIQDIKTCDETIKKCDERLATIDTEIEYNCEQREIKNEEIQRFGEVEGKQKRTKQLVTEMQALTIKINDQKKYIFKKFSNQGIYSIMNALLPIAEETLKNSDCLDKGIPGIHVEAVQYMLDKHKCICGKEIIEGSKEHSELTNWIKYLPPNNIGFEIDRFNSDIKSVKKNFSTFSDDFSKARKDLNELISDYNKKLEERDSLNEEIKLVNVDVSLLKQQESEYNQKVIELNIEKRKKVDLKSDAISIKDNLVASQNSFKLLDEKVSRLQLYYAESEYLRNKIIKFCQRKESEKRETLEVAMNEIFRDFYEEKIVFSIDSNYGVQIKMFDTELSEDFTSGGQDVAVALAFIGAIIKLNREKDLDPDDIVEEETKEAYPLVMDAPTSNFGMKQMYSFSQIMPKITDQIIVFINDKDGPILKSKMAEQIGSEWHLIKNDTYHSTLLEVTNNGK